MKRGFIVGFWLLTSVLSIAQDQQYTQFYAVPTSMNPAFAGAGLMTRFAMQYRNQWLALPGGFKSYLGSFDTYSHKLNSGFGLMFQRDAAGSAGMGNSVVSFQYAYETRIKKNYYIRPALQLSFGSRYVDFSNLVFYDQLVRDNASTTVESLPSSSVSYFDSGCGFLFYGPDVWAGFSALHLNRPNVSLYQTGSSYLNVKYSAQAGKRFRIKSYHLGRLDHHVVVCANYYAQGKFDQLDLGGYYEFNPIVFGLWYRGLPLKSNHYNYPNRDAIAFLLGIKTGPYNVGYSYDITASRLGIGNTAGAHELTFSYNLAVKVVSKRKIVPCAQF
jgi:type IX secretion system PorP/SprF family membrane protein